MPKNIKNEYGKSLEVKQNKNIIELTFSLNEGIDAKEFFIASRFSDNLIVFPMEKKEDTYVVSIDVSKLRDIKLIEVSEGMLLENKIQSNNEMMEFFDCCIRLKSDNEIIGSVIETDQENGDSYLFGNFTKTTVDEAVNNDNLLETDFYNYLKIAINCNVMPYFEQRVSKVSLKGGKAYLEGSIITNYQIKELFITLKGRDNFKEYNLATKITKNKTLGVKRYKINYLLDENLNNKLTDDFVADTYGVFVKFIDINSEEHTVRQKRLSFKNRLKIKKISIDCDKKSFNFNPLFSYRGKILSLQIDDFDKEVFKYLKKKIRTRVIDRILNSNRDIWLVSERIYKAQDNGYYFFKYMRENYPDKEVYYVIDENSSEKEKIEKFGNVVYYKSRKHIELTMLANKFISTHHYEFMLPMRDKSFKKKLRGACVFLQHGVMGTKYLTNLYSHNINSFRADSFIVSSEKEQRYLITDFYYPKDKVKITGLARFDGLFEKTDVKRQILIIPTWRDWLQNVDNFLVSEYFERYTNLINNEELIENCKKNNVDLIFCLHPNMQQYSHLFKSDYAKIIFQGEVDVQVLIKESAMMVTDYSSVGFDFSFLNKPLVYYMFDRDTFFAEGSHLDLDNDLAGRIVSYEKDLLQEIDFYINNGFKMKDKYIERANEFVKYKDTENSKRIMDVVVQTKKDRSIKTKFKKSPILRLLENTFRKNRKYIPIMKRLVKLMRCLPMKKDLVVIESGMGQIYGDSPKAIYEELKIQQPNMKKIVVSDSIVPGLDENTIRVKRLSFSYFYHLCVAKYWVNNQNYPFYMKRRKNTIYLQTWHGTPIKKMLFDLTKIYGRDEGYKARTTQAIQQWSHLLSPNDYSTKHFKTAFKHKAEVLELGYPRNDILYTNNNDDYINQIKDKLSIETDKKIILYAPTFRDDNMVSRGKFNHALELDFKNTVASLDDDTILLVRLHLVVSNELNIPLDYSEKIIDVSQYQSVEDLLLISDMLITDYSSIFFDYLNLERPIVFYAYDLEKYQDELRGFYLDYNEDNLPGPIIQNEEELYPILKDINKIKSDYFDKIIDGKKIYCANDDRESAKRVVTKIFK